MRNAKVPRHFMTGVNAFLVRGVVGTTEICAGNCSFDGLRPCLGHGSADGEWRIKWTTDTGDKASCSNLYETTATVFSVERYSEF